MTTHLVEIEQVHRGRATLARAERHRRHHRIVLVLDQVVVRPVRALHALDVVVAVRRHGLRGIAIVDDHRAQEHHQVGLVAGLLFRAEQLADPRNVAEQRHLAVADLVVVLHQAAQHDDLAVVGKHGRLDRTLGELRARRIGRRVGRAVHDRRVFRVELQLQNAAVGDLRLHVQRQTDVDAVERIERSARGAARQVRIRARLNRHVRTDDDLRFLVVERDQVRRRQHVRVGGLRQRLQQRAESLHTENVADPADVQTLLETRPAERRGETAGRAGGPGCRGRRRQVRRCCCSCRSTRLVPA